MLKKLTVKNVALIESAEIDFSDKLNILSGETGSGKSVILESINFVLGAKADKSIIRSGQHECAVIAEFDISNCSEIAKVFEEYEIDYEDILIIQRKFNLDGKSSVKLNGNTVTLGMLKTFTSKLVDVHGQSEHFYLLSNSNQLALIDGFGGEKTREIKAKIKEKVSEYNKIFKSIEDLGGDEQRRAIRLDVLNFQINEIQNFDLKENEEEELRGIKDKLDNLDRINTALGGAKNCLSSDGGVLDLLSSCDRLVSSIASINSDYEEIAQRISSVYSELSDISDSCGNLIDGLDVGEYNPEQVESRLDKIKSLKKKYGNGYEEINKFLFEAVNEKEKLENFDQEYEKCLENKKSLEKLIYDDFTFLTDIRRKESKVFSSKIVSELQELGMKNASFDIEFNQIPSQEECNYASNNGFDKIEFMFSANKGEPLKPLSYIISGGEISRFMLGIKSQTAGINDISTFIFDEIDAGISGEIAKVVAKKFVDISNKTQVIAISHLPQIAVMADKNFYIYKQDDGQTTKTYIKELSKDDRINEVIRLVGGDVNSSTAKEHAQELINNANEYKNNNK